MFYDDLPRIPTFALLADPACYTALPADWIVGTSDIVGSTDAIADGRYKMVNMIGAAVISAQINALRAGLFLMCLAAMARCLLIHLSFTIRQRPRWQPCGFGPAKSSTWDCAWGCFRSLISGPRGMT